MASARFRIGTAATNSAGTSWSWRSYDAAADVLPGSYCKVALESNDVSTIQVTIPATDELTTAATVTTNQSAKTATFQVASTSSHTYLVRTVVNGGVDANGDTVSDYTKQLAVHVLTDGGLRLLAMGERDEADRTWGHLGKVNSVIRSATGVSETYHKLYTGEVTTTDGTKTAALAIPIPMHSSGLARIVVSGRATNGDAIVVERWAVVARTDVDAYVGSVTVPADPADKAAVVIEITDDPAWAVGFEGVSTNAVVAVTGSVGADVTWTVRAQVDLATATPGGGA